MTRPVRSPLEPFLRDLFATPAETVLRRPVSPQPPTKPVQR